MKNSVRHIFAFFCVLACVSCSLEEIHDKGSVQSTHIKFVARPTNFNGYDVKTKADDAISQIDNRVSTAYFLAFNNKGERFLLEDLTDNVQNNTVPSMTLRSDIRTTEITVCYLVNVSYAVAESILTIEDLDRPLDIVYADPDKAGAIGVPVLTCAKHDIEEDFCFPMASIKKLALPVTGNTSITMELKRLFARMDVELSLNLLGDDEEHKTKFFTLVEYSLINLPNKVMLKDPSEGIESLEEAVMEPSGWIESDMAQAYTTDRLFTGDATFGQNQGVSFTFYAPEYFVNPKAPAEELIPGYSDIKPDDKQKYKPLLTEGLFPTLLRFKGLYGEGEEDLVKTLTYDIYLGRNNTDDFCIFRNYKYNNRIRIIDTQNFRDGGVLGVDHRVDLDAKGFLVGFKRATLLDAHFEVRPMRVRFPGSSGTIPGKVTIEILKEDKTPAGVDEMPWIRLERPASADRTSSSTTYYENGKRKFFTTDLVSTELKDNVRIEYDPHHATEGDLDGLVPIWVYVDENTEEAKDDNAPDKNRKAIIRVTFTPSVITEDNGIVSQSFTVQQRAMYPISYGGHSYNIEYFEEYLYDFDGQENYGEEGGDYVGGDGVVWGLNGQQLSHVHRSMFMNKEASGLWSGLIEGFMDMTLSSISPKYDFYLQRDIPSSVYDPKDDKEVTFDADDTEGVEVRDYSGYMFNAETIINQSINNGANLALNDRTLSAIEYCYKKNKAASGQKDAIYAESTGWGTTTYNTENFKWYLPAIDEMEDIIMGGKDIDFFNKIFSEYWYWSCQSAFDRYYLYYNTVIDYIIREDEDHRIGEYYIEDISGARATRLDGTSFVPSDSEGYSGLQYLYYISTNAGNPQQGTDTTAPLDLYYWVYERRQTGTSGWWPTYETKWWQEDKIYTFPYEVDDDGVHSRSAQNRVRCIYNPNPPKQIIKSGSGDDITYEAVY